MKKCHPEDVSCQHDKNADRSGGVGLFLPEDLIVVGSEINEVSLDSSKAGHELGETLTVENAIRGLIIPSGNDSANVVAAAVAKKAENDENMTFGKCEVVFTDLMNKRRRSWAQPTAILQTRTATIPMTTTPARTTLR